VWGFEINFQQGTALKQQRRRGTAALFFDHLSIELYKLFKFNLAVAVPVKLFEHAIDVLFELAGIQAA